MPERMPAAISNSICNNVRRHEVPEGYTDMHAYSNGTKRKIPICNIDLIRRRGILASLLSPPLVQTLLSLVLACGHDIVFSLASSILCTYTLLVSVPFDHDRHVIVTKPVQQARSWSAGPSHFLRFKTINLGQDSILHICLACSLLTRRQRASEHSNAV
jgi:hypothetical protein